MAKVDPVDLSNLKEENFFRYCAKFCNNVFDIINGKLEYDQNILSKTVDVTFVTPNVDVQVFHPLAKIVTQYIPITKAVACDVYTGNGEPTINYLFLRSTVATTVTIVLL